MDHSLGALNVLMVDDDRDFIKLVEIRLKSFLPEMQATVFNSLSALRQWMRSQNSPALDLVILDEHLPDGRGVELLGEGVFEGCAVLMISSDTDPEMPGASVQAGAAFFLNKTQVTDALFKPLVLGIIQRNRLQRALTEAKLKEVRLETVKTLVSTLRHEINNPLGAVMGAAYLIGTGKDSTPQQREIAELVESSGNRIKHVLDELCRAVELDAVTKGSQKVFHVPGDKPWK